MMAFLLPYWIQSCCHKDWNKVVEIPLNLKDISEDSTSIRKNSNFQDSSHVVYKCHIFDTWLQLNLIGKNLWFTLSLYSLSLEFEFSCSAWFLHFYSRIASKVFLKQGYPRLIHIPIILIGYYDHLTLNSSNF